MPRLTDKIREMIGLETQLQCCCDVVETGAVRRYAQAVMDADPIYMDKAYCALTRYGSPVAPPLFPTAMLRLPFGELDTLHAGASDPDFDGAVGSATYGLPPLPLENSPIVNGGVDVEFDRYVQHGEEIYVVARYRDIVERETSSGWMIFVHYECDFFDAERKRVLRLRRVQIRR
jgi:acyl dehydratase